MKKPLTAVLIDDELPNLKSLAQKLTQHFLNIEILEQFQKPEEAISYLNNNQPDIVFLDIKMPRLNGFQVLEQLNTINFAVIFVTAYSDFAIDAFKKNALDYILKPIEDTLLIEAVNKAIKVVEQQSEEQQNQKLLNLLTQTLSNNNKLIVPTSKGLSFIPQNEVVHLEGHQGYTKIHLVANTTILSSYNLGKFEKLLGESFFKCHKSHIVNLEQVRHFENEGYLVLNNKKRVPISRSNKAVFLDLFN